MSIFSINIEIALELPDVKHKAGKRAKLVSWELEKDLAADRESWGKGGEVAHWLIGDAAQNSVFV